MPRRRFVRYAELLKDSQRAQTHRTDDGLRDLRSPQRPFLLCLRLRGEGRRRIEKVAQACFRTTSVGVGKHLLHGGKLARQVAPHAHVLRTLAGEQQSELAGRRAVAKVNAVRRKSKRTFSLLIEQAARGFKQLGKARALASCHDQQSAWILAAK